MVDFSDGWFMFPLRIVQLVNSLIVLGCAAAGRSYLPNFNSTSGSPQILLSAAIIHVGTTVALLFAFYVFKVGSKVPIVVVTVFFEMINYGLSIASFVNMMYDISNTTKPLASICMLSDTINNPNPKFGCTLYQVGTSFSGVGWFLWTISMTWILSQIHKRIRKAQMLKYSHYSEYSAKQPDIMLRDLSVSMVGGGGQRAELESQGSTYTGRYPYTTSPVNDMMNY